MYQVGAHFEALDEGLLVAPLDSRYTQVGFNLISVQVCINFESLLLQNFDYKYCIVQVFCMEKMAFDIFYLRV